MIGFLRKNNNNVTAALVNNSANNEGPSTSAGNGYVQKAINDSSSESDASNDVCMQDIKARYSNRQPRDGSGSDRSQQVKAAQKVPGLNLLQVGGIGGAGKATLSMRGKHSYRSRNDTISSNFMAQSQDECKQSEAITGSVASLMSSRALEGGSAEMGGMASFNNARGTFRKKMSVLNNDGLSMREKQDLRDQLKNVKEVIDPNRSVSIHYHSASSYALAGWKGYKMTIMVQFKLQWLHFEELSFHPHTNKSHIYIQKQGKSFRYIF